MRKTVYCIKCRYNLHGLTENRCPECGQAFDTSDPLSYALSARSLNPTHIMVGIILLLMVFAWAAMGSGDATIFIDINSLIFVLGGVCAGLWMCFGPSTVIRSLLMAITGKRPEDQGTFTQIMAVLSRGYQLAWAAGLAGTVLGLIIMMRNMDDPAAIGPGIAVGLLASFYGLILAEFVLSPLQQAVISRVNVPMEAVPWLTLPQRSMIMLGFAGLLLLGCTFIICLMGLWPFIETPWPPAP